MWAYDADNAKMWVGRNGTWYHGDPGAGTNASFQNMPTSSDTSKHHIPRLVVEL